MPKPADLPIVGAITPFSATDYPNTLAAVIFLQGCPWRCLYCHNPKLQHRQAPSLDWASIKTWLLKRQGLIDAVVFSGGEPLSAPRLHDAIHLVKSLGFKVGLHTAGIYPRRFKALLPLLDWVGLDIKAMREDYDHITQIPSSGDPAFLSAEALLEQGISHEIRTTLHPALHNETQLLTLAKTLAHLGVQSYVWQLFQSRGCAQLTQLPAKIYPTETLIEQVSKLFPHFLIRDAI